jgi:hypothetical protein
LFGILSSSFHFSFICSYLDVSGQYFRREAIQGRAYLFREVMLNYCLGGTPFALAN